MLKLSCFFKKTDEVKIVKVDRKTFAIILGITFGSICMAFGASKLLTPTDDSDVEEYVYISQADAPLEGIKTTNLDTKLEEPLTTGLEEVNLGGPVYEGLTLEEVSSQLNRSLSSTLANQGDLIASYSIERGVDPYLATAIMLHETGCNYKCSSLVTYCNNVGGMKGSPSCGGGDYLAFSTIEEGIKAFIDNLSNNYYAVGLTTPELMNSRYAASTTWATKVNAYILSIKSK